MITGNKDSFIYGEIRKSRKEYYLLIKDNSPIGICMDLDEARQCLGKYTEKGAKKVDEDICVYEDKSGRHIVTINKIRKIKIK